MATLERQSSELHDEQAQLQQRLYFVRDENEAAQGQCAVMIAASWKAILCPCRDCNWKRQLGCIYQEAAD